MQNTAVIFERPHTGLQFAPRLARWAAACACASLLLALTGCGGGGGGAEDAGPAKVTLGADVFALTVGDRRHSRQTAGPKVGELSSEYVTGTTQIDGRTAFVVRDEAGDLIYSALTTTGRLNLPGPGSDALSAASGAVELFSWAQALGETRVPLDRTVAVDVDGDGRPDSADLRAEVTFLGYEDITTALGTFKASTKLRVVARYTYRYGVPRQSQTSVATVDVWLAPGIGEVRSSTSIVFNGAAPATEVTELFAYNVGPLRSERVAPTLLQSAPQASAVVAALSEIELDYSEELDPYVLAVAGAPLLKDANDQTVPTTLRLANNGKQLVLTPVTPLANGRYQVQTGNGVTDFASNAAAATTFDFTLKILRP
jgi:Bacterial Ig-like domain